MTRSELHKLIDELPEEAVEVAGRFLERAAREPFLGVLDAAPWDDEPISAEEDSAVRAALEEPGIPLDGARKKLLG